MTHGDIVLVQEGSGCISIFVSIVFLRWVLRFLCMLLTHSVEGYQCIPYHTLFPGRGVYRSRIDSVAIRPSFKGNYRWGA